MNGRRNLTVAVIVLLGLAAAATAQTPTPAPRPGDTLGWYVVRPGDTLEGITERFLGTPKLWRENWRLNPWLKDPHTLHAGDRLRVIVSRQLPPRSAELEKVARRVEEKPHPNPWIPAREGDLLRENDGCRTYRDSSARLRFDDGTRVTLTEESLVFLRRVERTLEGVDHDTVEVVRGQADLQLEPERPTSLDVEVVVGPAVARPRPGRTGRGTARLRREGNHGASVMVYEGAGAVEAAGTAVEVPEGMGTAVPENGPPSPPEPLLPAPRPIGPEPGAVVGWNNPRLSWTAVPGAASYTVEVCRDTACAELVARATGIRDTAIRMDPLPAGALFWRVRAVATSGLDGYPSAPRRLEIDGESPDRLSPVVAIAAGPGTAVGDGGSLVAMPGGTIILATTDDVSGTATVRYRWDGGAWRTWKGKPISVPEGTGPRTLEVEAFDRAGRHGGPWRATVDGADAPPEPPVIHGGVETGGRIDG